MNPQLNLRLSFFLTLFFLGGFCLAWFLVFVAVTSNAPTVGVPYDGTPVVVAFYLVGSFAATTYIGKGLLILGAIFALFCADQLCTLRGYKMSAKKVILVYGLGLIILIGLSHGALEVWQQNAKLISGIVEHADEMRTLIWRFLLLKVLEVGTGFLKK
ncbi:hypothetical protein KAZ57_02180 [Patescibacteria group bacterium]|nr:hypothetical protein [Patescibacteria group bacterium]